MHDVIIIGSGPAGLTAAIYTSRSNLKTLIIGGLIWGGQLMVTTEVENYPGYKEGILGPELVENMEKQARRFGAQMIYEDVVGVNFSSRPFKAMTENQTYEGRSVIIATGASPKWLGLESEERLKGRGVSACAICDGVFFKDRKVAVVGGGDTAVEEALALSKFASKVKVIHRRDRLRASRILQERAFNNPKIDFIWNSTVQEILGTDKVEGVRLVRVDSNEDFELELDGIFIAIGYKPNTEIFKGQIELDKAGYIVVKDSVKTNIEGIFAAGDVEDARYRQAVTAAASGCKAALEAEKYLEGL